MEYYTLTDIVENSAKRFPNGEAFKCGNQSITFSELDVKSSQLAKCLLDSGINKGDRVGIYLNRCMETAIAIYGILKAGAIYVPLDFTAPHARTQKVMSNCNIEILVSSQPLKNRVKKLTEQSSCIHRIIGLIADIPLKTSTWDEVYSLDLSNYSPVKIMEADLAYIMFTSGSTGEPKGIMHTHRSSLNYAKLSSNVYNLSSTDRVGNHAPIHFDISTFGYFSSPLAGATTIIVTDAHTKLPGSLAQLMSDEKLTIWYSVPLALVQLLHSGLLDKIKMEALKWVLFGGEVFGFKYLKELMQKWPHVEFANVYGPAEVNQCTYYHFKKILPQFKTLPLGNIWKNTTYKILNGNNEEVNKGEHGELVIRSGTMMEGYWRNKTLTEKSFYRENIDSNIEYVYYRTGDVVYEDESGLLFFVGRNDRQVKLRGYRIELNEVESVLLSHQQVNEVAVLIDIEQEEIYAAVILFKNVDVTPNELKKYCNSHLPTYAVPNRIEIFEKLPRTSSGKIDKKRIVIKKRH